jgi:hypothetical protein
LGFGVDLNADPVISLRREHLLQKKLSILPGAFPAVRRLSLSLEPPVAKNSAVDPNAGSSARKRASSSG